MDREDALGLRLNSIVVKLYRKTSNEASYAKAPYLTVPMTSNDTDECNFTLPTLTLPHATPTLSPMPRHPVGVRFIDGQ